MRDGETFLGMHLWQCDEIFGAEHLSGVGKRVVAFHGRLS